MTGRNSISRNEMKQN